MKKQLQTSLIAGVLALTIFTTAVPAEKAEAATLDDLRVQIALLLEQIAVLQGQTNQQNNSLLNITLSRNLSQGMTGSDVTALQQFLNSDPATQLAQSGVGSKGNETNYFGTLTTQAVVKFQNKYRNEILTPVGLSQGTGYVGPSTRAQIAKLGKTNPNENPETDNTDGSDSDTDDGIVAEDGDITVTRGSEHTNTLELSGGFGDIYSIQVKAEDSAMTIDRLEFRFDKRPWRYLDSFELYQAGERIASLEATEENSSSVGDEYRLRFLNLGAIVKKGEKDTFVLKAKALQNLSSNRELDSMNVYVPENGVRAKDTAKFTAFRPNADLDSRSFNFRDAANDGEIIVSLASNSPNSGVLAVKEKSNTSNMTVLVASVKADDNDIDIKDVYVKVTSSETIVSDVVKNLSLQFKGKTIATENVSRNGANPITSKDEEGNTYNVIEAGEYYVHFDDLEGIDIAEDDREELAIKAEFYRQSGRYSQGTDVTFSLRAIEGENSFGEDVANGNLTTGDERTFSLYTKGVTFAFVGEDAKTQGQFNRTGIYTLTFDVTAFGENILVPISADRQTGTSTVGSVGAEYSIVTSSGERYALGTAVESLNIKGAKNEGSFFRINEGSTHSVVLSISLDNAGAIADFYRAELEAFRFLVGSTSGSEYTITTGFNNFETDVVSVKS